MLLPAETIGRVILSFDWPDSMVPTASPREPSATNGPFVRRLVAIAFTDIVNYSALMAEDEDQTHARWMAIRHEIVEPRLRSHRGHLIKSTGDGVLVEFCETAE